MGNYTVVYYDKAQITECMSEFQKLVNDGKYTDLIPYPTWRKIKKCDYLKIVRENYFVKIFDDKITELLYSDKTYNNGFARFWYDKEKERDNMKADYMTAADKAYNTAISTTNVDALESKVAVATYAGDLTAASTAEVAKLADTYYGTISTSHPVAINGKSVSSNQIELNIPSLNDYWNDFSTSTSDLVNRLNELDAKIATKMDKADFENRKENEKMKGFNFDFGPCGSTVRLSMYGMAIQNIAGEWVSYNPASKEIVNVDVFNMPDGGKYMYKMPVAIKDVKEGDIIIHNRVPMFVTKVNGKTFEVTDVRAGEAKTIIPATNMFGFNFLTKVVSMLGSFGPAPTADNPFGNMLPLLMMSEGKDIDPMMLMFMMGGQGANMFSNPMMMYFLMKDNKDIDPMLMFMMMNNNGIAPATEG